MNLLEVMIKNFKQRLDWGLQSAAVVPAIVFLSIVPVVLFAPESWNWENSWLENVQLIVLGLGFVFALCAKHNKMLFRFLALAILLMMLREVNYGRTIFFPVEGEINKFHSWKDIKYGWLAHPLVGVYCVATGLFFLINKLYLTLWEYIKKAKIPAICVMFVILGTIGALAGEELGMEVLEEIFELLLCCSVTAMVYFYAFDENYRMEKL